MVLFKTLALVFALYSSVTCAPAGPVPVLLEGKLLHSIMTNDHQLVTFTEDVLPTGRVLFADSISSKAMEMLFEFSDHHKNDAPGEVQVIDPLSPIRMDEDLTITDEWDKHFAESLDPKTLAGVFSAAGHLGYYSLQTLAKKAFAELDSDGKMEFENTLFNEY